MVVSSQGGIEDVCTHSALAIAAGATDGLARNDLYEYKYEGLHEWALWAGISYSTNTLGGAYRYGGTGWYSWFYRIQGKYAELPVKQTGSMPSSSDVLCR